MIYNLRKSLLFDKESMWMRKVRDLLDVAMGAYNGAEAYKLVGTFLLGKLVKFVLQIDVDCIGMTVYQF